MDGGCQNCGSWIPGAGFSSFLEALREVASDAVGTLTLLLAGLCPVCWAISDESLLELLRHSSEFPFPVTASLFASDWSMQDDGDVTAVLDDDPDCTETVKRLGVGWNSLPSDTMHAGADAVRRALPSFSEGVPGTTADGGANVG